MRLLIITFFVTATLCCFGQVEPIQAEGKIRDSRTGKGVRAHIRYKSIPTGGITGKFHDSTFTFVVFGTAKYAITAEARGYNPRTVILDPKFITKENKLLRDVILIPRGETIVLNHLIFQKGKADIDPKSFSELDEVAEMMKQNPRMVIQLEGHTDNVGNAKANMELSQTRVEQVKKYLVEKGIEKKRILTRAFGGTQPLKNEMTQEARALNRRVEMRILKD